MEFLTEKFSIDNVTFEMNGKVFSKWIRKDRLERGAAKKVCIWPPSSDSSRSISWMAFGLEHGTSVFSTLSPDSSGNSNKAARVERSWLTSLKHSQTQYQRRLTVYSQQRDERHPTETMITDYASWAGSKQHGLSCENTIIIYDICPLQSGEILLDWTEDQFCQQRTIADRGKETPLFVGMEKILENVFASALETWKKQVALLEVQYTSLEDRVYELPSDDSHAGELWAISKHLLEMSNLVTFHSDLIKDVQEGFNNFRRPDGEDRWLDDTVKDIEQLGSTIQKVLIQPTDHLLDLVRFPWHLDESFLSAYLEIADVQIRQHSRCQTVARTQLKPLEIELYHVHLPPTDFLSWPFWNECGSLRAPSIH